MSKPNHLVFDNNGTSDNSEKIEWVSINNNKLKEDDSETKSQKQFSFSLKKRRKLSSTDGISSRIKKKKFDPVQGGIELPVSQFRNTQKSPIYPTQLNELLGKRNRMYSMHEVLGEPQVQHVGRFLHKSSIRRASYYNNIKGNVCVYFSQMQENLFKLRERISKGSINSLEADPDPPLRCSTRKRVKTRRGTLN